MSRAVGVVDSIENPDKHEEASLRQLRDLKAGFDLLKNLLAKMESVYSQAESALQDELGDRSRMIESKDAVLAELKQGLLLQLRELKEQLDAKEELLKNRDGELESLRSEVGALAQRAAEGERAKEEAERRLGEELEKRQNALEAQESARAELERSFDLRLDEADNQLRAKEQMLKDRDGQIETLRSESSALSQRLAELTSEKEQMESLLRQELERKTGLLAGKDSAVAEMEAVFTGKIAELESQLNARAALSQDHGEELEELRSNARRLTQELAEAAADRERAETSLREELNKKEEMLRAMNSAANRETNSSSEVRSDGVRPIEKPPIDPFEILLSK
jgi:DNA repair exonuclease SbcCD ATPase subunit